MRTSSASRMCAVAALLGATVATHGQELQRVDPNVADISPLSTSLRELETGLQLPTSFRNVYQVPGREGEFMRVDGAIYAVFPQSTYFDTREGTKPGVPPGTVFYIGPPPPPQPYGPGVVAMPGDPVRVNGWIPPQQQQYGRPDLEARADGEPDYLTNPVVLGRLEEYDPTLPRVVSDETYRRARLHELMQKAAEAQKR